VTGPELAAALARIRQEAAERCGLDAYPADAIRAFEEPGDSVRGNGRRAERLAWERYLAYVDQGCADEEDAL